MQQEQGVCAWSGARFSPPPSSAQSSRLVERPEPSSKPVYGVAAANEWPLMASTHTKRPAIKARAMGSSLGASIAMERGEPWTHGKSRATHESSSESRRLLLKRHRTQEVPREGGTERPQHGCTTPYRFRTEPEDFFLNRHGSCLEQACVLSDAIGDDGL